MDVTHHLNTSPVLRYNLGEVKGRCFSHENYQHALTEPFDPTALGAYRGLFSPPSFPPLWWKKNVESFFGVFFVCCSLHLHKYV